VITYPADEMAVLFLGGVFSSETFENQLILKDMSQHQAVPVRDDHLLFARHNFDNHQAIIRAADTKAAVLTTLLLFLGASTIPLGKDAVPKLRWVWGQGAITSGVYLFSYLVFAATFAWSLVLVYRVVIPRGAAHYQSPRAGHDLLYYEHVLLHQDSAHYFESVGRASPDLILRNLTDQVFELAHICHEKITALHRARMLTAIVFCAWTANTVFGLWIVRWK